MPPVLSGTVAYQSTFTNGLNNDTLTCHFNAGLFISVPYTLGEVNPVCKGVAADSAGGFEVVVGDHLGV